MVNYGGDEVSALVIDIGTSSLRAGYAGDDSPKAIIPSACGFIEQDAPLVEDVAMTDAAEEDKKPTKRREVFVGANGPSMWRAGMHIENPIQNGMVTNFDDVSLLISHALTQVMRCNVVEHPVLVTEPAWNTPANRERMAEIMFEEFQVPAFYIANTGVLNAFAAGKGSALVIDIGQSVASVTPVIDGFVLRKGLMQSATPQLVHAHARHLLLAPAPRRPAGIQLWPHQLIASKQSLDAGMPPKFELRQDRLAGTTDSWKAWSEAREVDEWIHSIAEILDQGWNDQAANLRGSKHYEFPTGYNTHFSAIDRCNVGEQFFSHTPQLIATNPNLPKTLPNLISASLTACDPDLRQVLLGNVVLTGGGSLFPGFGDRLLNELQRHLNNHVKIHAAGNPIERRYGGWLGGSILGSLGTFHQLWISKEEWQEHGKAIVGQRCK